MRPSDIMDTKRAFTSEKFKALIRIGNEVGELLCSKDNGHVLVHVNEDVMTLPCAVLGLHVPFEERERFIREDPDLAKTGDNERTCCGCWRWTMANWQEPRMVKEATRSWLEHKISCRGIQDLLRFGMQTSDGASQRDVPDETPESAIVSRKDGDEETLDEPEDGISASEVGETAPSRLNAKTEARRKEIESSAFSGEVESKRVWCIACDRWIGLTTGEYSRVNWRKHVAGHLSRQKGRYVRRRSNATTVAAHYVRRKSPQATAVRFLGPDSDGQGATSRVAAVSSGPRRARVPLTGGNRSIRVAYPHPHESSVPPSSTARGNGSNEALFAGARGKEELQVRFVEGGAEGERPKMAFEVPLGVTRMELAFDFADV